MTPIDIIAAALLDGGWAYRRDATRIAHVVADALTDDRIINHAIAAVRNHTWTGPDVEDLSDMDLRAVIRVAFGSLKEGGRR